MTVSYPAYSLEIPRTQVIKYLADAMDNKDRWIIVFPTELSEHVGKILIRIPDSMFLLDNGSTTMWVCGGIDMLVPIARIGEGDTDNLAVAATLPRDLVPPEAISRVFNVPPPQEKQSMIALCTDPERVPVPAFFLEALEIADPETAAAIRGREVP